MHVRRLHRYFLLILALGLACLAYVAWLKHQDRNLRVYFLDVGQGDAIYVRAPGGHDMLVDGGPSGIVLRRLSEVMPFYDRSIDVLVETHPDADHIGGLPQVMKRFRIGVFLEPGVESENAVDDEIRRVRGEEGIDRILARRGMQVSLGGGASFDILFPDRDVSHLETNTASIVGRVRYGSTGVVLTGDSPKVIEAELVRHYGSSLKSDVLKAGHHGSHTSSGEGYVRAISPGYAIISAGKDNRYGHPHREVTDLFGKLGIPMLSTYEAGTVECVSDGRALSCR
ncbi:MAG: ComEC/Rec2 family competence protein [Candidatus Paceibacterota bacterium]